MSGNLTQNLPSPNVAIVDNQGKATNFFYTFLLSILDRTGGTTGIDISDIANEAAAAQASAAAAQTSATSANIAAAAASTAAATAQSTANDAELIGVFAA
jgi:hypothetical protein